MLGAIKFLKNSLLFGVNLNRTLLLTNSRSLQLFRRPNESKDDDEEEEDPVKISLEDEQTEEDRELMHERIEKMRDKSRLKYQHRNILHDTVPYTQAESWIHETLKYKRMMYGRYGKSSGVDPSKLIIIITQKNTLCFIICRNMFLYGT